ncbi:MAG TPA: DUF411 domain-containing protein [Variovorax sp.]|nr:DUF411 domain-containing protein [Variovorax sp.]
MNNHVSINRRTLLAAGLAAGIAPAFAQGAGGKIPVEVWKDPSCGCCKDWVTHLESNGFAVKVNESGNNTARSRLGIDRKFGSCHTAQVGGYAIEGHVPAGDIKRLLKERPTAVGLAVPGMPVGSPGMDGPDYGGRKDAFDVLLLTRDGGSKVFRRYEGAKA